MVSDEPAEQPQATDATGTIEEAFAVAESAASQALRAAATVQSTLKRYKAAAAVGKVGDLKTAADAVAQSVAQLERAAADVSQNWDFDTDAYLQSGAFNRELIASAHEAGVRVSELDNRLYCYPSLIRVLPADRAVQIDKIRERRIRPSVLVRVLQDAQRRPPRFRTTEFLEALFTVYQIATKLKPGRAIGSVVPLMELYDLLTTKPGDARDYSKQEFARDIYLLDRSGDSETKNGAQLEFHAGAGARLPASSVLSVVTQQGSEKKYHGVAFSPRGA